MVRSHPRPRHAVNPAVLRALTPFYRYDTLRRAYIMRGVGRWVGPVLRSRP